MVRYLQASDLHGTKRVDAVIRTANRRDDLDAIFFLGDLVDTEYGDGDYEYRRTAEALQRELQEAEAQLNRKILEPLGKDVLQSLPLYNKIAREGGIDNLRAARASIDDERVIEAIDSLIEAYESSQDSLQTIEARIEEARNDPDLADTFSRVEDIAQDLPSRIEQAIREIQDKERTELDDIFSRSKHNVYVGEGNHDGQALRNLEHATNITSHTEPIRIKGLHFAYEANTKEACHGSTKPFYEGLDSIEHNLTTEAAQQLFSQYREAHGDDADLAAFRTQVLQDHPIYNRLSAMDAIDILLLHNPVGQNAILPGKDRRFIDYQYAVGEIIKEKKPAIIGWGHLHGKTGKYSANDHTFGYPYQGVHSTNNRFYVIDVDETTRKISWIDVYSVD